MNIKVSEAFGLYFARLPLTKSPSIINCNALTRSWKDIIDPSEINYILGNPPFGGSKYQTVKQRAEIGKLATGFNRAGILNYVSGWYLAASEFIQNTDIEVGFVSTNSITQGEQVGSLWPILIDERKVKINFGYRTFQWTSEARGKAAVHCVIIGFSLKDRKIKELYDYETVNSEPKRTIAKNINPYLVDGPSIVLHSRTNPICEAPHFGIGNKPIDDGNYLFNPDEKMEFLLVEPNARKFFRRWIGAKEYLNNIERWCLWLGDCPPHELRNMPECMKRVEKVRNYRLVSASGQTKELADRPTRFHVENMPEGNYLVIPGVSSERREYIPIGFMPTEVMASNLLNISSSASLFHFGVLSSLMHMSWVRYTAGRLKSDYRYSVRIVYNNYPWPKTLDTKKIKAVEFTAMKVLDARKIFPESTLSDLYDPVSMPPVLRKAHQKLNKAVDLCYRSQPFTTELNRVSFLFELYEKKIS